jgi:hypothetical protein
MFLTIKDLQEKIAELPGDMFVMVEDKEGSAAIVESADVFKAECGLVFALIWPSNVKGHGDR